MILQMPSEFVLVVEMLLGVVLGVAGAEEEAAAEEEVRHLARVSQLVEEHLVHHAEEDTVVVGMFV